MDVSKFTFIFVHSLHIKLQTYPLMLGLRSNILLSFLGVVPFLFPTRVPDFRSINPDEPYFERFCTVIHPKRIAIDYLCYVGKAFFPTSFFFGSGGFIFIEKVIYLSLRSCRIVGLALTRDGKNKNRSTIDKNKQNYTRK